MPRTNVLPAACGLLFALLLAAPTPARAQPSQQAVVTSDLPRFWAAHDAIRATADSARQHALLDSLFLSEATPGLTALMDRRGYTAAAYLQAIRDYPRFWASIRPLMGRAEAFSEEIEAGVARLRALYPALRPAPIYFTVGALQTGGTTLDRLVLIGAEVAMADHTVVTDELPERLGASLRAYFDTDPVAHLPFLSIHEYVHTQQGPFGGSLLAVALQEGVAEFVATQAAGQPSPAPAVAFGQANEAWVRERFAAEMFSPNYNDWLYNDFANEFGVRDLGYYVGYAIAKRYCERSQDETQALARLIELDYQDAAAVEAVAEASGYFGRSVERLRAAYERNRPRVVRVTPFEDGHRMVEPGARAMSITFSERMSPRFRGFDYGPLGEAHVLRVEEVVGWSGDGRTLNLRVALTPEHRHQVLLTSQFRTERGVALEPYLIDVTTAPLPAPRER